MHFIGAQKPWYYRYNLDTNTLVGNATNQEKEHLGVWWNVFVETVLPRLSDFVVSFIDVTKIDHVWLRLKEILCFTERKNEYSIGTQYGAKSTRRLFSAATESLLSVRAKSRDAPTSDLRKYGVEQWRNSSWLRPTSDHVGERSYRVHGPRLVFEHTSSLGRST